MPENETSIEEVTENSISEISEQVELPIGIEKDGARFKTVVLDEFSGVDEQLMADKKKVGKNNAKGMTLVLSRAIQEIVGLIPRKKNPDALLDYNLIRNMYQIDRDFLYSRVLLLAERDETVTRGQCAKCGEIIEEQTLLSDQPVIPWPTEQKTEIEFELKKGFFYEGKWHKKGSLRFVRGSDQEQLSIISQTNRAKAVSAMFAACITKIGEMDGLDQSQAARLKSRDRLVLLNTIRDKTPGLKMWSMMTCPSCMAEVEGILDLTGFLT